MVGKLTLDGALIERWQARQARLADLLEGWGAASGECRVEWEAGFVEWYDADGQAVAIAEMKALCSYDIEERTLMMAWANEGADQAAVIESLPDVPPVIEECEQHDAWQWAMRLAEESGAGFLYRIATPSYLVFLGLWDTRPVLTDEEGVLEGGAPSTFVINLLDELRHALLGTGKDSVTLRRLFLNHGDSLHQNAQFLTDDGADPVLLSQTVDSILDIGHSFGQRRFGLLPPSSPSPADIERLQQKLLSLRSQWLRTPRQE